MNIIKETIKERLLHMKYFPGRDNTSSKIVCLFFTLFTLVKDEYYINSYCKNGYCKTLDTSGIKISLLHENDILA